MSREIRQAKAEAERARKRFAETLACVGAEMPGAVANQAWTEVRDKGSELADDAVEAVKKRPVAASAAVAAIGLFLARDQITSAASRLLNRRKGKRPAKKRPTKKGPAKSPAGEE
jgi:hypothetical protein